MLPRFLSVFLVLFSFSSAHAVTLPLTKEQIFQMATVAAKDGSYQTAADLYTKVLDLDPRFAPAYNSLGLVYQAWGEGSAEEAIRYFRLATEVAPDYIEAWNNLGRAYYTQGNFSMAKGTFLRAIEVREDQPDIHLALAWVYLLGESDADGAIEHFEKALAVLDNDMAHYGLGLAHLLAGEKFKVLDQITELRRRQKDSEAAALEKMVRENARISSPKGTPLVTGKDFGKSVFEKELSSIRGTDKPPEETKGISVRLTEPLR